MSNATIRLMATVVLALALAVPTPAAARKASKKRGHRKAHVAKSLYDRLGRKKGITELVDDFVANCAADTRINTFFAATAADPSRLTGFKRHLVEQLCQAAGGPCRYTGKSMKEAHQGMGVREEHFTALVEDLVKSLEKRKVRAKDREQLLGVLGPLKNEIVENQG